MALKFTAEFNVESSAPTTEWTEFKQFIDGLRNQLASGQFSNNCPLLPLPHADASADEKTSFHVVLKTNSHVVTLKIRSDNLFPEAYRIQDSEQWLEFNGSYKHLERVGHLKRKSIPLGQSAIVKAVNDLAAPSGASAARAQALIVVIQIICESIRFSSISDYLASDRHSSQTPPYWMLAQENAWNVVSAALLRAHADPNHRFHLPQDNVLNLHTAKDAIKAVGFLPSAVVARGVQNRQGGGQPLLEVFSVRINDIDRENPGDLYGTIKVIEALGTQFIYNRDNSNYESIRPGEYVRLSGPQRPLSAFDNFTIELNLMDYDTLSSDDEISRGDIYWHAYDPNNIFDRRLSQDVPGQYGSATVDYIVFSNAVAAKVEVLLINGDGENPADIYGNVVADNGVVESELFRRANKENVEVRPMTVVPLDRTLVAVPLESSTFRVRANLIDYDSSSSDDEVANGTADFSVRKSGSYNQNIYGKYGSIQVTVTWLSELI